MKACSSASGGVMFVEDSIERCTNKQRAKSYKDIVGEEGSKTPIRDKILGVFKIGPAAKTSKVA